MQETTDRPGQFVVRDISSPDGKEGGAHIHRDTCARLVPIHEARTALAGIDLDIFEYRYPNYTRNQAVDEFRAMWTVPVNVEVCGCAAQ